MSTQTWYLIAADVILLLHVLFVGFVVFGLVLIFVGKCCHWAWVQNLWFRIAHLIAIGFVVMQSWLGAICPLTILENELRASAGDAVYEGDFIAHWLQALLYYQAPTWVFTLIYTGFGLLVVASWFWIPPRRKSVN